MRLGAALCALAWLTWDSYAQADEIRGSIRFEAGGEYDTNPHRAEQVTNASNATPVEGSPLGRMVLSGDLNAPVGTRVGLSLVGSLAAKTFAREAARAEDVVVADGTAGLNFAVAGRTSLGLAVTYYDVFQRGRVEARDFRSTTPALRLDQGLGGNGVLSAGAGYRRFTYKPYPDFDFAAPTAFVLYRSYWMADAAHEGTADWEWSGGASAELRAFSGNRCEGEAACMVSASPAKRRDQFWILHAELVRTGAVLLGGGLAMHGNSSNSYGEPLTRGLAHLRTAILLPGSISLSARGEVVFTRYRDAVPIALDSRPTSTQFASIEDESRSTARVELVRPFSAHFEVGVRYTVYASGLNSGPVHYLRQTALVFCAVTAER